MRLAINELRRKFMLLIFSLSSHHGRDPRLTVGPGLPASFEYAKPVQAVAVQDTLWIQRSHIMICVWTNVGEFSSANLVYNGCTIGSEPVDKLLSSTTGGAWAWGGVGFCNKPPRVVGSIMYDTVSLYFTDMQSTESRDVHSIKSMAHSCY